MTTSRQSVVVDKSLARGYAKPKRKEFFENLYLYLSEPLPEDESRKVALETKYLMAVAALTAEIQPASAQTYDQVLQRRNAVLLESSSATSGSARSRKPSSLPNPPTAMDLNSVPTKTTKSRPGATRFEALLRLAGS